MHYRHGDGTYRLTLWRCPSNCCFLESPRNAIPRNGATKKGPNGWFWRGQGRVRLVGLSTPAAGFGACPACSPCLPPPHCHHRFPLGHCKFILGLRKSPTHNSVNNHQDPYSGVLRNHTTITSTRIFEWACCILRGAKRRGEILSGSTVFNAARSATANF